MVLSHPLFEGRDLITKLRLHLSADCHRRLKFAHCLGMLIKSSVNHGPAFVRGIFLFGKVFPEPRYALFEPNSYSGH